MNAAKEKLLKKTFSNYINLMLNDFPIEKIKEIVADDIKGYGTTLDEKMSDISRLQKMVEDQREQGKDFEIGFQHTPIHRRISPNEDIALYTDDFLLTMEGDNSKNIIPLRLSSVFEFNKKSWKLVHIHGSQAVDTENDTWHLNEWKKKNEALQKMVTEKTADLSKKNRELEIESSLERVRSLAMGMQRQADLLKVCKQVYLELQGLGFTKSELRNALIIINNDDKGVYYGYQHSEQQGSEFAKVPYNIHPTVTYMRDQLKKSDTAFADITIKGKKLADWKDFVNSFPQKHDKKLNAATELHYYFYSVGIGALGISSYQPLAEDKTALLHRFSNVFNLAYQRYEDITQADAQAREVQIELGLERVRARTMAMQHSHELAEATEELYQQLSLLGIIPYRCNIAIVDQKSHLIKLWSTTNKGKVIPASSSFPIKEHPYAKKMFAAWKKKSRTIIKSSGKARMEWTKYIQQYVDFKEYQKNKVDLKKIESEPAFFTIFSFKQGCFIIHTLVELIESDQNIIDRFAKVFEQTYTRFLDLQKAEEQAREAQIEAALERVRARSMAMQYSDELADVATILFQQVKELGIPQWTCGFNIWETGDAEFTFYPGGPDGEILPSCKVPLNEHPIFRQFDESRKRGDELFIYEKKGEVQADHYRYMHSLPGIGDMLQGMLDQGLEFPEFQIDHIANFAYGNIVFITYEPFPEMHDVFIRFAKVFEQTYTRFLDLQKAEEQAREAEIELALERVRARTMAMQKSNELGNVATVLFNELNGIVENLWTCGFVLCENDRAEDEWWLSDETGFIQPLFLPNTGDTTHSNIYNAWKKGEKYHTEQLEGKALQTHYDWLMNIPEAKKYFEGALAAGFKMPVWQKLHCAYFNTGYLVIITEQTCSEEDIFIRFAQVFDQTYTRFLDLQKAEAQAQEAKIEAALERVRSRAMALQKSDELMEVVQVIFDELNNLGSEMLECSIVTYDDINPKDLIYWSTGTVGKLPTRTKLQYINHPFLVNLFKDLKKGVQFRSGKFSGKLLKTWWDRIFKETDFTFWPKNIIKSWKKIKTLYYTQIVMNHGFLEFAGESPIAEDKVEILKRFTNVIDLTYTRFDDLKQAEAQAREGEIELALERVRSRSMAMHNSEELKEVVKIIFDQMAQLKINAEHAGIVVDFEPKKDFHFWVADNQDIPARITVPYLDLVWDRQFTEAKKKGKAFFTTQLDFEEKNSFYKKLIPHIKGLTKKAKDFYLSCPGLSASTVIQKDIGIYIENFSGTPFSDEDNSILERFGKVFQQSYTRFLDLQKAEAQAWEARVEASMEKIRAASMAMHKSSELLNVIQVISAQLEELEVRFNHVSFGQNDQLEDYKFWTSIRGLDKPEIINVPKIKHPLTERLKKVRKEKLTFYTDTLTPSQHNSWNKHLNDHQAIPWLSKDQRERLHDKPFARSLVLLPNIFLVVSNSKGLPFSEQENQIIKRVASVFEQTYTRFLDLQKAETQAREAQIEAALERVRAKSMAMQNSNELSDLVDTVFNELQKLDFELNMAIINVIDEATMSNTVWARNTVSGDKPESYFMKFEDYPFHHKMFKAWKEQKTKWVYTLKGKEKTLYDDYLFNETEFKRFPIAAQEAMRKSKQYVASFTFSNFGGLQTVGEEPVSEANLNILARFGKVFDLNYTRFNDLLKAEAQAKEAIKQAALDRVRGEIASMRTAEDLMRITPVIWHELQALEVPFVRCGVFIMNNEQQKIQTYLSTPDGESLTSFELDYHAEGIASNTVKQWKKNKVFKDFWEEKQFTNFMQNLIDEGKIADVESFRGKSAPPQSLYLHFVPFTQGMLYVGDLSPLIDENLDLVKTLAEAFSIAYARYEDFKHLEEAKNKIESTLNELKSAQTQLVQAEKMASLGELTAGIAHEIQNPLNFVNNFSEVSSELLEELKEELENGDFEEVKAITGDVMQNLEKILQHGNRASGIVKSMLQHSRGSTGQIEPVDINGLADEYLRLAYHGLRAKDKSFNADFKTDFDESLPKINVVPQEIGRVLLNLINNAFYAVSEKAKHSKKDYKPTVTVSTKSLKDKIEIRVRDNGDGIPQKVIDKIFQPFFTTKPTGQGTGLGLSMSYDIVTKGHGGELRVETIEGESTNFLITLPI